MKPRTGLLLFVDRIRTAISSGYSFEDRLWFEHEVDEIAQGLRKCKA